MKYCFEIDNEQCEVDCSYIRRKKAEQLVQWHGNKFDGTPMDNKKSLRCDSYYSATILPLKKFDNDLLMFGRGGVVQSNGTYVDYSGIPGRIGMKYDIDAVVEKDYKVAYCGYLINHWGHFLVEAVSRLWYFLKNDSTIDKYVFFVEADKEFELKGNIHEFFRLFGVLDKLEIINKATKYREVVVPEMAYIRKEYYSEWFTAIYDVVKENALLEDDGYTCQKIFLTRSRLLHNDQTDIGGKLLDHYFEKNGYMIVAPEKESLVKLICLMNSADEIAAISGTLPHHMLFTKSGRRITILERHVLNNDFQADINIMKKLKVTYIDSNLFIYPMHVSFGPFLIYYTEYFRKYTDDYQLCHPDQQYLNAKYLKKVVRNYINCYRNKNFYSMMWESWYAYRIFIIDEAYQETMNLVAPLLDYRTDLFIKDKLRLFNIKQYIKRVLKKILQMMRGK